MNDALRSSYRCLGPVQLIDTTDRLRISLVQV